MWEVGHLTKFHWDFLTDYLEGMEGSHLAAYRSEGMELGYVGVINV